MYIYRVKIFLRFWPINYIVSIYNMIFKILKHVSPVISFSDCVLHKTRKEIVVISFRIYKVSALRIPKTIKLSYLEE